MNSNNLIPFYPKNHAQKKPFIEAVLLFSVFFLPGYFQQGVGFNIESMLNPVFHFFTLIFSLPQMLLLLYILHLRVGPDLEAYGVVPLRKTRVSSVLISFICIMGITLLIGIFDQLINSSRDVFTHPGITAPSTFYDQLIAKPGLILLIAVTCLLIGYFEELFFRVYLIKEFAGNRYAAHFTIITGSVLFAAGHAYQGVIAATGTFFIGVFLGYRYLAHSSWHEIALAHALYNFTAILMMPAAGV